MHAEVNRHLLYTFHSILPQRHGSISTSGIGYFPACFMIKRNIDITLPGYSICRNSIFHVMKKMLAAFFDLKRQVQIIESHPNAQYIGRVCLDTILKLIGCLGNNRNDAAQRIQLYAGCAVNSRLRSIVADNTD